MKQSQPIFNDVVLLGGGHSHAIALRMFGMKPMPGVRITLLTEASDTAYSGMLPGHVAGFYSREECHMDLRRLAQFAGAQFYIDRAIGLDLAQNRVLCANRPPVAFDLLSINIGSTPKLPALMGDREAIIPAKPVRQFLERWDQVVLDVTRTPEKARTIGIVGGGAGGVELALTMQHRLQQILKAAQQPLTNLTVHLFQKEATLLPTQNRWVRDRFHKLLAQRGIQIHLQEPVQSVQPHQVIGASVTVACDYIFWVTQAAAPDWLAKAGLAVDEDGFVLVDDTLRSLSHPNVFAAGDTATMLNHPRPKAGVFAVRQGKPLVNNLRRAVQNKPLKTFRPQAQYLSLIGTGDGEAIAVRGSFGWQSPLLWRWKDWIDRAFMQRFSELPQMKESSQRPAVSDQQETAVDASTSFRTLVQDAPAMRCAGCGAKVGSSILSRALQRVQKENGSRTRSDILIGLEASDDAAVVQVPAGSVMVQTIDYFPALLNDPFVFGQISANHALSDLFAMGAQPQSVLAIATIPYAQPANVEETLYQLLSGAMSVLNQAQAVLIGGHTTEGAELAFGLSCNGLAQPDRLLRKCGMKPGQALILTKAIGTGTLFAAHMQLKAKGRWLDGAIASMQQSNQRAATCLLEHCATACTDVTGFGLVGHLTEMVQASNVAVTLNLAAIPLLEGALETLGRGITSSLQPQNLHAMQAIANASAVNAHPFFPLLFDPQTSGGLLASVPVEESDRCLTALRALGYTHSAIIGHTTPLRDQAKPITIA
ncbi:MAG: selenide, water dikinase SelD [Stenomitos rutilans HA7619-LM2]|jgi:selenide,water dikinase|nr:selenide, water dikinase SelD [Stenomitos rutilans HA7619-LM2]